MGIFSHSILLELPRLACVCHTTTLMITIAVQLIQYSIGTAYALCLSICVECYILVSIAVAWDIPGAEWGHQIVFGLKCERSQFSVGQP
jgi:hypothetical protein